MSSTIFSIRPTPECLRAGVRIGDIGTHTSRTMMLFELRELLSADACLDRDQYKRRILDDNVLGKGTATSRRSAWQRLSELYGIDPQIPIFRVLHRLWALDPVGRPLLALLCALARDPLLRATAPVVLPLAPGSEVLRSTLHAAIAPGPIARFNLATLDKIARNTASTWLQSGHLQGRVRKIRCRVTATAPAAAFALWLGSLEGFAGDYLLQTLWTAALDAAPTRVFELALDAKRLGLLRAVAGGGVREIDVTGLDRTVGALGLGTGSR